MMHQPIEIDSRRIFRVMWIGHSCPHTLSTFCNIANRRTWDWFTGVRRTLAPNDPHKLRLVARKLYPEESGQPLRDYPMACTMNPTVLHLRSRRA